MKTIKLKKVLISLLFILLIVMMSGCAKEVERKDSENKYLIYYVNKEETQIASQEFWTEKTDIGELTEELMVQLTAQPEKVGYKTTIPSSIKVNKCYVDQTQIVVDFDAAYLEVPPAKEILMRAALVKTLTQIPEIEFVLIQINREPFKDISGNLVGVLGADMFVNYTGEEINNYEKVKLKLYLSNEKGDKLIPITRTVVYNKNTSTISMEKLVIEELIKGPANEESFSVMNPETKIINITTKDGVCYLNLSEDFLTNKTKATPEVTIYAISNTLIELSNVNKVQILINGESKYTYRETMPLSTIYERNLDIINENPRG